MSKRLGRGPRELQVLMCQDMRPEEVALIDGLARPCMHELTWSIRSQRDQGDACVICLDDGGMKVCSGAPRRTDEHGWGASELGAAERKKGGGALVDVGVRLEEIGALGERQRQRRGA